MDIYYFLKKILNVFLKDILKFKETSFIIYYPWKYVDFTTNNLPIIIWFYPLGKFKFTTFSTFRSITLISKA